MEPIIIEKNKIILLGFSFCGDPFRFSGEWTEENEIGRLWKRFFAYLMNNAEKLKNIRDDRVAYEVHIQNEETTNKGIFEVFVGVEIEDLNDVPYDAVIKILPVAKYAVFKLKGKAIMEDWQSLIFEGWLANSGYDSAHNFGFQLYDERFKGMGNLEESEVDVYIPIKEGHRA